MPWWQVITLTPAAQSEALSDHLMAQGAVSVTFSDGKGQPLYELQVGEKLLWDKVEVIGLFEMSSDSEKVLASLNAFSVLTHTRIEQVDDQDWNRVWMDQFHPLSFANKLWICPSWLPVPDPSAVNVILDPGMAFGTGTHPTTALMLDWLDRCALAGKTVIDYGCGSGILAIAAAKLGAQVIAVDNDPDALEVTLENAQINALAGEQLTTYLPEALPPVQVDILIANILAQPLLELAAHLADCVQPGGLIVLSGILAEQADDVSQHYNTWFAMNASVIDNGWVRLEGRRKT